MLFALLAPACHAIWSLAEAPTEFDADDDLGPRHDAPGQDWPVADRPVADQPVADGAADPLGPFSSPRPVAAVNTEGVEEDDVSLTQDMREMYFERAGDIWWTTRPSINDPWGAPLPAKELNSVAWDGMGKLSADGLTFYLTSARTDSGSQGADEIYVSTRADRALPWTSPTLVTELNSPGCDQCPYMVASEQLIVFNSNRSGGHDLYQATRSQGSAGWEALTPIADVNGSGLDECPWIDVAFTVIYFTSDRAGGQGGRDLWVSTRNPSSGAFDPAVQVPALNTSFEEADPWLSPDLKTIYFASTRNGDWDIFVATR